MIGFVAAGLMYLQSASVRDHITPGDWYWYSQRFYNSESTQLQTVLF